MDRMEYKIEWVDLRNSKESRLELVVERVNKLAADGWQVVSVDLTPHPAFEVGPLPVLLGRPAKS